MTEGTRFVVPTERHVERVARSSGAMGMVIAETRARLRKRLIDALAPKVTFASPVETRLALAAAMREAAPADLMLAPLARDGGEAWMRTLDALHGAIGALKTAGARTSSLASIARLGGTAGRRARALGSAMQALDARLREAGLADERDAGIILESCILQSSPQDVMRAVGAPRVAARWIVAWDGSDVAWWRALDTALSRAGGSARIELPSFDAPLDPNRDRDVLEVVADDLARALDGAPESMKVDATLGDLRCAGAVPEDVKRRVSLRHAADAQAQARAIVDAVASALDRGAPLDEIAVGMPRFNEETIAPLRAAFDDARIAMHEPRGDGGASKGIAAFALDALSVAARGLLRGDVAALVRARYIDPRKLSAMPDVNEARGALADLARALDSAPTSAGPDSLAQLEATVRAASEDPARGETRAALARRVGALLLRASAAATRAEHVAAARAIWADLGLDPTRSRGARATLASDEAPHGISRAELRAFARDASAWERLNGTLDAYEAAAARLGVAGQALGADAFRHELASALDLGAPPAASRAAAIRIAPLAELAGEKLSLLVVADANDGVLPSSSGGDALLSDALASSLHDVDPRHAPPTPKARTARELAALVLAASGAEHVVCTYRARDEGGALLAPAPLVAWLERGGASSTTWRASPLDGPPINAREATLRRIVADPDHAPAIAPSASRRARIERTRESFFEKANAAPSALQGELPHDARLRAILTHESGGGDRPMAVTSLEGIARCTFQGFGAQVLRAREQRAVREIPDAREAGTLAHAALAAAFTATRDLWPARPRDASLIRTRAMEAVDALVRAEDASSMLRKLALARLRDGVAAVIDWSLADDVWDFALAEQRFGERDPSSWPALRIDDGKTTLLLRGSIDRVDTAHGPPAVRAIDYKSSRTAVESGMKSLGETVFQIALYARAASDALRAGDREGLYVPTQRRDVSAMKPNANFAALWRDLHSIESDVDCTRVERRALAVVEDLRSGALVPRPRDKDGRACDTCALSGGCRKPRFAIALDEDAPST